MFTSADCYSEVLLLSPLIILDIFSILSDNVITLLTVVLYLWNTETREGFKDIR